MKPQVKAYIIALALMMSPLGVQTSEFSEQLSKISKTDIAFGAASFLAGFMYKFMRTAVVQQALENYSEIYRRFSQDNTKHKELELLTYFARTYQKDITNKCKIAVRIRLSLNEENYESELMEYYELCQQWGRHIIENIHQTEGFYDVDKAFEFYIMSVERELNWSYVELKKMKKDPSLQIKEDMDSKEKENRQRAKRKVQLISFLEAQKNLSDRHAPNVYEYPIDFSLVKAFYSKSFEYLFEDMFDHGKLDRCTIYLNSKGVKYFDELYSISNEQVQGEEERMEEGSNVSVVDNFEDAGVNTIYKYYQAGWMQPLVDVRGYYPTLNE